MDEDLINLVKNSKVRQEIIKNKITHPITGQKLPNRTFFILIEKYANDFFTQGNEPRMIGFSGLRGTGKTTLMWQLAYKLIERFFIYFFNGNELKISGYSLWQVMQAFQEYELNNKFNQITTPFVLLFDEVHDLEDWTQTLKIVYDEAKTAFIVCTGSSALLLRQTPDLARRMKIEKVYPFRFMEFITAKSFFISKNKNTIYPIKGFASNLKNVLFYSQDVKNIYLFLQQNEKQIHEYWNNLTRIIKLPIDDLLKEYIYYHNIPAFLLYKEKSTILEIVFDLLVRVVYEDVLKLNQGINVNSDTILRLLLQLSISDEINPDNLSQKVKIKKEELNPILNLIQDAELINILNPYSGAERRIYKNKKAFFMSPSIRLALLTILYGGNVPSNLKGKLYEDIVVMYLIKTLQKEQILCVKLEDSSPDFMIENMDMNQPIIVEIGKSKTKIHQLKSLEKRYGILISSGVKNIEIENGIIKLPLELFLLL